MIASNLTSLSRELWRIPAFAIVVRRSPNSSLLAIAILHPGMPYINPATTDPTYYHSLALHRPLFSRSSNSPKAYDRALPTRHQPPQAPHSAQHLSLPVRETHPDSPTSHCHHPRKSRVTNIQGLANTFLIPLTQRGHLP